MKAKSTIRRQIRRLRRLAESDAVPRVLRLRCYDSYHALRWAIEDVSWSPAGEAECEAAEYMVRRGVP